MNKILLLLNFLLVLFLSIGVAVPQAFAHTLKTSGTIGAVMHVTPEDDPIAGEQSDFFFDFKDTSQSFSPENCDCTISIEESGHEILSKPLFSDNTDPSLTHASISYIFPSRGIYAITITGKPIRGGTYKDFRLTYDLRVERESEKKQDTKANDDTGMNWIKIHAIHAVPAFIAIAFIGYLFFDKRKQKNVKREE